MASNFPDKPKDYIDSSGGQTEGDKERIHDAVNHFLCFKKATGNSEERYQEKCYEKQEIIKRKIHCKCTNISIMHLFHEMKQRFPTIPDGIVTEHVNEHCHEREICIEKLLKELSLNPIPIAAQTYPSKVVLQQQQQQQRERLSPRAVCPTPMLVIAPTNDDSAVKLHQQDFQNGAFKHPLPLRKAPEVPPRLNVGMIQARNQKLELNPTTRMRPTTLKLRTLKVVMGDNLESKDSKVSKNQTSQNANAPARKPMRSAPLPPLPPLPPRQNCNVKRTALTNSQQSSFSTDSSSPCRTGTPSPLSDSGISVNISPTASQPYPSKLEIIKTVKPAKLTENPRERESETMTTTTTNCDIAEHSKEHTEFECPLKDDMAIEELLNDPRVRPYCYYEPQRGCYIFNLNVIDNCPPDFCSPLSTQCDRTLTAEAGGQMLEDIEMPDSDAVTPTPMATVHKEAGQNDFTNVEVDGDDDDDNGGFPFKPIYEDSDSTSDIESPDAENYTQMETDDSAEIIRQIESRDKLLSIYRNKIEMYREINEEIKILKTPYPEGMNEELEAEIAELQIELDSILNAIERIDPNYRRKQSQKQKQTSQSSAIIPKLFAHTQPSPATETTDLSYTCNSVQQQTKDSGTQSTGSGGTSKPGNSKQTTSQQQRRRLVDTSASSTSNRIDVAFLSLDHYAISSTDEEYYSDGDDDDDGDNDNDSLEKWSCKMCTFRNHPQLNACECCETLRDVPEKVIGSSANVNSDNNHDEPSTSHSTQRTPPLFT